MASVTIATYDKGDIVRLEMTVTVAGVLTDPTLSTLTVKDPTGTLTPYTIANGGLTRVSVGLFRRDHDTTAQDGLYAYGFTGTGAAQVYEEGRFYVQPRLVA